MLQPPVSDLAPWRPGYWITQTGYALNEGDVKIGNQRNPRHGENMISAAVETKRLIERVMSK